MDDGWGAREEGRVGYFEPPKIIFVRKMPPVTTFLYAVVFLVLCSIFAMLVRLNVLAAAPTTLKYLYMLVDDNCMLNEKQTEAFYF